MADFTPEELAEMAACDEEIDRQEAEQRKAYAQAHQDQIRENKRKWAAKKRAGAGAAPAEQAAQPVVAAPPAKPRKKRQASGKKDKAAALQEEPDAYDPFAEHKRITDIASGNHITVSDLLHFFETGKRPAGHELQQKHPIPEPKKREGI